MIIQNHDDILSSTEVNGQNIFTTREDEWFFNGYNLEIDIDEELNEPKYHFEGQDDESNE